MLYGFVVQYGSFKVFPVEFKVEFDKARKNQTKVESIVLFIIPYLFSLNILGGHLLHFIEFASIFHMFI